jgi:putative ABC transport system permease protein
MFERLARTARLGAHATRHIWRFRLRSGLMLMSGILGVSGVIAAGSYAAEGRLQVLEQIRRLGANVLVVAPRQSRAVAARERTGQSVTTLIERDYAAIQREVPDLESTSAIVTGSFLVKHGNLAKNDCLVVGTEASFLDIKSWSLLQGKFFDSDDVRRAARVAVLGAAVARDLFNDNSPVGQPIFINRMAFEVIGVLRERGQGLDAGNEDNQVYVPIRTAAHRLLNVDFYNTLLVSISRSDRVDAAAAAIEAILLRTHRPAGREPPDFEVQNQKALVDTRFTASRRLNRYVDIVSACALAMSGLGILAICWVSVGERNIEIGLRRALGATKTDIFVQFLLESAIVSIAASGIGLALGMLSTKWVAHKMELPFFVDFPRAFIVALVAIALNMLFGLLPARRAASMNPVRALRSD